MMIRTRRLTLRPPFPEDWRELHAAINDEGVVRMLASAPWPYLPEHARDWCAQPPNPREMRFVIALPGADGAPIIGSIGIGAREAPTLGYWIARDHRRQGFATEAIEAVLDCAATIGHRQVVAGHWLDNPASGAVLARCGFVETGELRAEPCLGRGGVEVVARRYACDLAARRPMRAAA